VHKSKSIGAARWAPSRRDTLLSKLAKLKLLFDRKRASTGALRAYDVFGGAEAPNGAG
jgi:hypothetical protein